VTERAGGKGEANMLGIRWRDKACLVREVRGSRVHTKGQAPRNRVHAKGKSSERAKGSALALISNLHTFSSFRSPAIDRDNEIFGINGFQFSTLVTKHAKEKKGC